MSHAASDLVRAAVERFNAALDKGDIAALGDAMADDVVFENTNPAPDGTRYAGREAVLAFWRRWLDANPGARFEAEEVLVAGDRAVVRWVYRKDRGGVPWHVRGVDLFRVRDGKVSEYELTPEQFGFDRATREDFAVANAAESKTRVLAALDNTPGPVRDIVLLNAGAALYCANVVGSIADGVKRAREAVASGAAAAKLSQFVAVTHRFRPAA